MHQNNSMKCIQYPKKTNFYFQNMLQNVENSYNNCTMIFNFSPTAYNDATQDVRVHFPLTEFKNILALHLTLVISIEKELETFAIKIY